METIQKVSQINYEHRYFGTFLLHSFGNFPTVSFELLVYTRTCAPDGKAVGYILFTMPLLSILAETIFLYVVLAIAVTILFNILPLLLNSMLYYILLCVSEGL